MSNRTHIYVHPLLWIVLVLSYFLGLIVELSMLFLLIAIHEAGHLFAAKYFKWHVKRLVIWPFGGVMETEDFYNRPSFEELIVTLAGPIQHVWIFGVIYLYGEQFGTSYYLDLFFYMNLALLLFNLLPILPLDGGRFLFLLISQWFPFYRAVLYATWFSIVAIIIGNVYLFINGWFLPQLLFISSFLLLDNWFVYRNHQIYMIKHMLARYFNRHITRNHLHHLTIPKETSLQSIMKYFKKNHYHFINIEGVAILTEDEYLETLFHKAGSN